jgi:hypothetical protein
MKKIAVDERLKQRNLSSYAMKNVPWLGDDIKNDEDVIKWVFQIVYTRAFEAPDSEDLRIVPMGDMFNHASDYVEVEPWFDEEGNYYGYSTYDISAGSPLRISYGDSSNPSFMMARYGFLDEDSPATNCKLLPPHINQDMLDLGYEENRMLFYNTGEVSEEVRSMLRSLA